MDDERTSLPPRKCLPGKHENLCAGTTPPPAHATRRLLVGFSALSVAHVRLGHIPRQAANVILQEPILTLQLVVVGLDRLYTFGECLERGLQRLGLSGWIVSICVFEGDYGSTGRLTLVAFVGPPSRAVRRRPSSGADSWRGRRREETLPLRSRFRGGRVGPGWTRWAFDWPCGAVHFGRGVPVRCRRWTRRRRAMRCAYETRRADRVSKELVRSRSYALSWPY